MKAIRLTCLMALTSFVFYSCNQPAPPAEPAPAAALSQSQQMKAAYQEVIKSFISGNTDSLGKYVAENSVDHGTPPPGITSTGLQRLKDIVAMWHSAYSDVKMNYHHVVVDGDKLIAHGSWSGTNTGSFMGMPATNKPINNVQYVDILRWENGKFVEHWEVGDGLSMMTQLGIIPPQEGMPAATPAQLPSFDWNAAVVSDSSRVAKMKESYMAVVNIIQSGDLTNIPQYLAADFKENMQIPGATLPAGVEGAKQAMAMFKQAYPDLKMTVDHIAAEGDVLMAHVWVEGTLAPGFPGLPPTAAGKKVKFATADIVKFNAEGKGTEHWEVGDHYTELVQLGVLPNPTAGAQAATN